MVMMILMVMMMKMVMYLPITIHFQYVLTCPVEYKCNHIVFVSFRIWQYKCCHSYLLVLQLLLDERRWSR